MSAADWTMGSNTSRQEAVDPGRTLIAEVTSSGALMYAPRTLQLLVGADAICVRTLDGRLVWLETADSSAFTAADGRVHEYSHSGEEVVMVLGGAEGQEVASRRRGWAVQLRREPTGSGR